MTNKNESTPLPIENIPSGCLFPDDLIQPSSCPFIDLGSGGGSKAKTREGSLKRAVAGIELNQMAVMQARSRDVVVFEGDASSFAESSAAICLTEQCDVLMEGLLCNGIDPSSRSLTWKKFLATAHLLLRPSGYLYIADVESFSVINERDYPNMTSSDFAFWKARWHYRYDQNNIAFPEMPHGSVLVMPPGRDKQCEWGDHHLLRKMYELGMHERFVVHVSSGEVIRHLHEELGMELVVQQGSVWESRESDRFYPGYILVFQKKDQFLYRNGYRGKRVR